MLKFFRNIRQRLLAENRLTKYLLYAIGEILLVVVGILIALGVDQRSQLKANEAKIEAIFEIILQDLVADIEESSQIITTVNYVDSIAQGILFQPVIEAEEISEGLNIDQVNVITFTNLFNFTDGGFRSLSQNLDILPSKYNDILSELNAQYGAKKESVQYWDEEVNRLAQRNDDFLVHNMDWYHDPSSYERNNAGLRADSRFKNLLFQFDQTNTSWLFSVSRYRESCVDNYQQIAALLGLPIEHPSFEVDQSIADLFNGEWHYVDQNDSGKVRFYTQDGRLFYEQFGEDAIINEMVIHTASLSDSLQRVRAIIGGTNVLCQWKDETLTSRFMDWHNYRPIVFSMVRVE